MKSTISFPRLLAGAACALMMVACDSVRNVPPDPLENQPPATVVLEGTISNMSSLRSITLMNNGDTDNARSFIPSAPTIVNGGPATMPFSFGSLPVGSAYNITIKNQPFGKLCTVQNGQGTLTAGVATHIAITCTNSAPRYNLTVSLPNTANLFQGLAGAKVRVTTEEEIIEKAVTAADSTVTFPGVLINATGQASAAAWTVTASTFEGNSINKCAVANPQGNNATANVTNPAASTNPAPIVGTTVTATTPACKFAVGGSVGYSLPAGVPFTATTIDGLVLQLRDPVGTVLDTKTINCTPTNATVTTGTPLVPGSQTALIPGAILSFPVPFQPGAGCTYKFDTLVTSGISKGLYEVVVSQQPTSGTTPLRCLVANGGNANVYTVGTTSPVEVNRAHVLCRAVPATPRQLKGIYRLQSSTWTPTIGGTPVTSTYDPFNYTVSNTASSNFLALFDDGTFLYGSHGYATNTAATQGSVAAPALGPGGTAGTVVGSVPVGGALITSGAQVENGFYDFDATAQTLRFTLVTDTNNSAGFPATFSPLYSGPQDRAVQKSATNTQTTTGGLSATPNPEHRDNSSSLYMATMTMTGVTFGTRQVLQDTVDGGSVFQTVRTMSGEFGGAAGGAAWQTVGTCATTATTTPATIPNRNGPCLTPGAGAMTFGNISATPTCTNGAPCVVPANGNRLKWELQEPPSINNEMTGAWMSQDYRRIWVWDHRTIYGFGAAVVGGHPSMNDACFTMENLHQSSGFYVRRGSGPGCHPFSQPASQPAPGQLYSHAQGSDSTDYPATILAQGVPALLPGFIGRIPGGQVFPGNTTASPVQFHIAPAASFASSADPTYFPNLESGSFTWCKPSRPGDTAEVLGMRYTSNNLPIDIPVYLCRVKVPVP